MATGAVVARILTQYSDKGSKAASKDINKLGKDFDKFSKKVGKSFAIAGAAAAAFAFKIGKDSIKAIVEDNKAQAILASTLRNTTGATKEAIAAVEKHIAVTKFLTLATEDELRKSFGDLAKVTGSMTDAQLLLQTAMDLSAYAGVDLATATNAITKAYGGKYKALKNLKVPITDAIEKNRDFTAAINVTNKAAAGQAKILADLDPYDKLKKSYEDILETLGEQLLPVLIELATVVSTEVLPKVLELVEANKEELAAAFKAAGDMAIFLVEKAIGFSDWVSNNTGLVKFLAGVIATMFILNGVATFILMLDKIRKAYILLRGVLITTGIANAFATGGLSVAAAAAAVAGVGILAAGYAAYNNEGEKSIGLDKKKIAQSKKVTDQLKTQEGVVSVLGEKQQILNDAAKNYVPPVIPDYGLNPSTVDGGLSNSLVPFGGATTGPTTTTTKVKTKLEIAAEKLRAAQKIKNDKIDIAYEKQKVSFAEKLKNIEKARGKRSRITGVTDQNEYDLINLKAAEMLLDKQKKYDDQAGLRIKTRMEELALFKALNENATRYADLLSALADDKLSNDEIQLLANKWGLTVDAAKSYIFTIFAIKDEQVSDDEVAKLAEAWGITKAQAGQYLEFFAALNDGKLSDAEIAKLMSKWGLTKDEAKKYADFVAAIGDGKLDDSEINKLKNTWGLTTEQVVAYIIKIGGKVDASGTILSAGDIAALGWTNALNALNAYLAALGKGTGGTPTNPVVIVPKVTDPGSGSKTDSAAVAASASASKKAADAYAEAKAKGDMNAAAIAAAGVTPSALAAGESGAIGAASIAAQLRAAEAARAAADAAARQASSLSAFKAKEAADLAASQALSTQLDYDERSKFRSMTLANASSMGTSSSNSGVIVNLTVTGSVSTEQDLVSAVRNGLLATQTNGNGITLQAV